MGLTMVGLGSGGEEQLTLGVWKMLKGAHQVYLRTEKHPVVSFLQAEAIAFHSFDEIYLKHTQFTEVYEEIVRQLLAVVTENPDVDIVYAVPGHPAVAERTAVLLRAQCAEWGIDFKLMGGESFLDQAFLQFQIDPIDGFQCVDASLLKERVCNPFVHMIIGQVYDSFVASDVKLTLMRMYPDDYEVVVGHALGVTDEQKIERIPLYELDRVSGYGNLSLIWVPKAEDERVIHRTFDRLREIVEILRSPEGCPWDREQTHVSIRKNLIEETCEVLETIDADQPEEMCEELGDLLLQIMLHAQMEDEIGQFSIFDVVQAINDKLIRRHPHVFGDAAARSAEDALRNWQAIKDAEKQARAIDVTQSSILAGLPRDLTSLLRALKLQKKAATVGFDWSHVDDVLRKCAEEWAEWQEALQGGKLEDVTAEFGDVLFSLVNAARFLQIDPEAALALTNRKFERRFQYIEAQLKKNNLTFADVDLQQMDNWWNEAKQQEFL